MSKNKVLAHKLIDNLKEIADDWIEAIRTDELIKTSDDLKFTSLKDHLPHLLEVVFQAFAGNTTIEQTNSDQDQGEEHGITRALQDFNTEEIAREYYLLKQILLHKLQADLLTSSPQDIIKAIARLDQVIDEMMANSLKTYTQRRLNQLENLQSQLLLTNQELTRLIEDHQENLSYLTHEIKTPLTSIIGYSDLFLRQQKIKPVDSTTTNLSHIEQVLGQGRKILRLVNDTLEISSYSKGKIKITPRPVDVCKLLDSVIISLKSAIEAKGLKLTASCSPEPLQINTDSLRLQQIISNLVSNAIRYTDSGKIEIFCEPIADDRFKIIVSDTGIGISQADYQRIFNPYFRVTQPNSCIVPEGIGLGLAIVAQLVKLLGGEIQLESKIDVGSTFTVILPMV